MKFSPIVVAITSSIVGASIIASVIYHYQRETTSIEDKYAHRSGAEVDDTYHQSYLSDPPLVTEDGYYDNNVINDNETYGPEIPLHAGLEDDWDGDGWSNDKENEEGTQPDNPDTDGDGIIDSQDPYPNDPTKGGVGSPGDGEDVQPALVVNKFYKHVCNNTDELCDPNQDKDDWEQFVYAEPGDLISFYIYIQLNTSDLTNNCTATLTDFFGSNLEYYNNAMLRINNGEPIVLDDFQYPSGEWYNNLPLFIGPDNVMTYEIYFETIFRPQLSQSAINLVNLEIDMEEKNILSRRAFVFKR